WRAVASAASAHGGAVPAARRCRVGARGATVIAAAPLRLGLVGCGRLAELGYVPAVARTPGVEIVAVADLSKTRRTLLASKLGASAHPRLGELLAAGPLDGLVICTTPEHHEEAAAHAAAA